jgi:hypothetical protein
MSVAPLGRYDLRLGVQVGSNPTHPLAAAATVEVAWRLGLFAKPEDEQRYHRSRFVHLSASAYPTAAPEVLRLAELWHFWLFSFDDRTDERHGDLARDLERHQRLVTRLLALLDDPVGGPREGDPHAIYLGEILDELRRIASPRLQRRFDQHVRNYLLHGSMPGALNELRREVPSLEEFIPQRLHEGAVFTVLPFVELSERIDLSDQTVTHPLVQRLQDLANLIIALTNDFFSYEKEVTVNRSPNNLLVVIGEHRGLGLSQSVLWALGLLDGYLDEYVRLSALFEGHTELTQYVRGLSHWICASQKWYADSGRYVGATKVGAAI